MSLPYIGEIRMFGGNFAPVGWAFCEGQVLPISENGALFTLIGTTYGGDGEETFALPDLRGRVPMHSGAGFTIGEMAGVEEVTLTPQQIPAHSHAVLASTNPGTADQPNGAYLATSPTTRSYSAAEDGTAAALRPESVGQAGGSQPHTNFQPYLCVNHIIALSGVFPSQT